MKPAKWYSHNIEDYFQIIIIRNKQPEVYQAGTEADIIGTQLKTFKELEIRFKSFTGYEIG